MARHSKAGTKKQPLAPRELRWRNSRHGQPLTAKKRVRTVAMVNGEAQVTWQLVPATGRSEIEAARNAVPRATGPTKTRGAKQERKAGPKK
jgi:hypothetical protein